MTALEAAYAAQKEIIAELKGTAKKEGDYLSPVFGAGALNAELMLIGEAPGAQESREGTPFVGKAGQQLDEMLTLSGIQRDKVFITNAVKYRPMNVKVKTVSNRTPDSSEIKSGQPLLRLEITTVAPRVIATLGNTPLSSVLDLTGQKRLTVGQCHGRKLDLTVDGLAITLFPLYHPASVIYNRSLKAVLEADLAELGKICV